MCDQSGSFIGLPYRKTPTRSHHMQLHKCERTLSCIYISIVPFVLERIQASRHGLAEHLLPILASSPHQVFSVLVGEQEQSPKRASLPADSACTSNHSNTQSAAAVFSLCHMLWSDRAKRSPPSQWCQRDCISGGTEIYRGTWIFNFFCLIKVLSQVLKELLARKNLGRCHEQW